MTTHFVQSYYDRQDCARWWREIPSSEWVACDVETTGLDPWNDELRLVQFGTTTDAWAIDPKLDHEFLEAMFGTGRGLVGWQAKFDEQFLRNAGFLPNFTDDAKAMAYLLHSEVATLGLKHFADIFLGADSSAAQASLKQMYKATKTNWATVPVGTYEYWHYGCVDTILTAKAADFCYPKLIEHKWEDLYDHELVVAREVIDAERRGMPVDVEYCQEQYDKLTHDAAAIQARYPEINLMGRTEVIKLLVEGGAVLPRTPKGKPSLTDEVLATLTHPIAQDIRDYRGLLKNANTYFASYLKHEVNGRIHTTMNTTRAKTGRFSSSEPNLQNVPKREAGDYVRRAFKAPEGYTFVFADYHQIEYRIFASACGEPAMINAFLEGKDMHAETARMTLGHEPTKRERDMAKNGNFAELYMAGVKKFAATAGISEDAATRFKQAYHRAFPRIKPFGRSVIRQAQAALYAVYTPWGRRIGVDQQKPYVAVNYGIQGTARDVITRAIERISHTEWRKYFLLQVHDELVFLVPDADVERISRELPDLMEDRSTFQVPLTVEVSAAKRWGE